jgi:hypothetical protein
MNQSELVGFRDRRLAIIDCSDGGAQPTLDGT